MKCAEVIFIDVNPKTGHSYMIIIHCYSDILSTVSLLLPKGFNNARTIMISFLDFEVFYIYPKRTKYYYFPITK